jgi:ABC-type branched-subunit amino acid transport system substrate-binding protein/mono/diheme cytochrome c family protein
LAGGFALTLAVGAAPQGPPADDVVAAGRRLYREGLSTSGHPVEALVQGDVPVLGTQMTCQSCHRRSGMGAIEGGRIPSALVGPLLFAPDAQRRRPGYSDGTLARALREGIDPAGRSIDPLMPRFRLEDRDVAALAAYLRQLGAEPSPGVGTASLRLATLVAGDVATDVQQAMLDVVKAFVADRNRSGPQRLRGGHAPNQPKETFREWSLDVWRVGGPPESWRAQIETQYRERPVFALVGGVASGTWQPIHDFCEAEQMPCLLPDADLPPADEGGFYSFYVSRGLRLEAEIIAAALAAEGLASDVIAAVEGGPGTPSGEAAATLARAIERRGGRMRTLDARRESNPNAALARSIGKEASAIVLWVKADGVRTLAAELADGSGAPPIFLSSILLDAKWDDLPAAIRSRARVVHLSALPGESDPALQRFRAWARAKGLQLREERHQALAYFACLAFAESTKHMGRFMFRDYLLDLLDHASNLTAYLPMYLRAGLTPGQRVLSRGGYVVDLSGRLKPVWLVP